MALNSLSFVLLFPVACLVYYFLPQRLRQAYLLMVSIAFYMTWHAAFALFLVWVTLWSYLFGRCSERRRRVPLWAAVSVTLLPLAFFKYFNFLSRVVSDTVSLFGLSFSLPGLNWMIPIGISFYTFQAIGYIADVYKGKVRAERNMLAYALFICFFPQLLSGPISRADMLLPQLKRKCNSFNYALAVRGARLLVWGMFFKVVVADRLGLFVDTVFDHPADFNGLTLLFSAFCYSFQIYTDFAGYTLLAVGSANVLGFCLPDNFMRPYLSVGFRDFWRRWHISLSSWLRDYVYIPLGGSRVKTWRIYFNLLVTFFVSGLWHGANYTFVVWGLLHGVMVCVDRALQFPRRIHGRLQKTLAVAGTFVLVTMLWILFRAPSISTAGTIIGKIFTEVGGSLQIPDNRDMKATVLTIACMLPIVIGRDLYEEYSMRFSPGHRVRMLGYWMLVMLILLFGVFDASQFIYFSF